MPSSQAILDDVNLLYRNTFTDSQILVWFNEEQRELFDVLELDSPPLAFTTVLDENFYPFPADFDVTKIKTVTYQNGTDTDNITFIEVPFARNDDRSFAPAMPFYSIVSDAMFFYVPDSVPAGRLVYIYTDSDPTDVTVATLGSSPDLPTKFQELLKLGILKRIAMARKDAPMYNNYTADYQEKISNILWDRKLAEPEWPQPIDGNYHVDSWNVYSTFPYRWGAN